MSGGRASHPVAAAAAAALLLPQLVLLLCPGGSPGPVLLCLRCPLRALLRPWCGAACEACSRSAATHSGADCRQGIWGAAEVLWHGCVPHPVLRMQHPSMRSNLLMLLALHTPCLAGWRSCCLFPFVRRPADCHSPLQLLRHGVDRVFLQDICTLLQRPRRTSCITRHDRVC